MIGRSRSFSGRQTLDDVEAPIEKEEHAMYRTGLGDPEGDPPEGA